MGFVQNLLAIGWFSTTLSSHVQFRSIQVPRRVMHVGWIGVARDDSGNGLRQLTWGKYIEWEHEVYNITTVTQPARWIVWHIELGCTIAISVAA